MPTLDWKKWSDAWSAAFPKNAMWAKVRSDENDPKTGEPLYRWDDKPDTRSTDPALADVLAAHRFVAPAVPVDGQTEYCFCGWSGVNHGDHLQEKVNEFVVGDSGEQDTRLQKKDQKEPAAKKATPKKVVTKTVTKDDE